MSKKAEAAAALAYTKEKLDRHLTELKKVTAEDYELATVLHLLYQDPMVTGKPSPLAVSQAFALRNPATRAKLIEMLQRPVYSNEQTH